ncbi:MAG: hypothetical protein ACJ796_09790 [Gemmatimonadaceae bacterium]
MFLHSFPKRSPTPAAHRRFRLVAGLIALAGAAVLALQYTPRHLLSQAKIDTLWGILAGMAVMTVFAEYQWSRPIRRDRADSR